MISKYLTLILNLSHKLIYLYTCVYMFHWEMKGEWKVLRIEAIGQWIHMV